MNLGVRGRNPNLFLHALIVELSAPRFADDELGAIPLAAKMRVPSRVQEFRNSVYGEKLILLRIRVGSLDSYPSPRYFIVFQKLGRISDIGGDKSRPNPEPLSRAFKHYVYMQQGVGADTGLTHSADCV